MPRARRTDPDSSHRGAEIDDSTINGKILIYLRDVAKTAGATSNEIAEALDIQFNSVSPRLKTLADQKLVRRHLLRYNKKGNAVYECRKGPRTGTEKRIIHHDETSTKKPRIIWWHVDYYSPKEKADDE